MSPRDLFYYANECMDNQKYDDAVLLYETFLNQDEGWYEEKIYACGKLGDCYAKLGLWEKAVESCVKSFRYAIPRGENCTRIGYIYMEQQNIMKRYFGLNLQRKYQWPRRVHFTVQLATHGFPIYKCAFVIAS